MSQVNKTAAIASTIVSLYANSPVHVGAGNSVGVVDSPIMRERHTKIPIIPGSSLKGVLADFWENDNKKRTADAGWLFGAEDNKAAASGALLIGEARVILFPVRSAKGSFAWITCPLVLARYNRDAGLSLKVPELKDEKIITGSANVIGTNVILEEYVLQGAGEVSKEISEELTKLLPQNMKSIAAGRINIVSDEMFSYFCEFACEVVTRIKVDDETGTVAPGALFNQEQVPSETVFYTCLMAQPGKGKEGVNKNKTAEAALKTLLDKIQSNNNLIQVGGDATTGLGFCTVTKVTEVK